MPPPHLEIKSYNPWIAQEWLEGSKYCTYSICHEGSMRAHATYPVRFAIDGNSCLTFEAIEHAGIHEWVEKFAKATNFTGQIAFDFIELPGNKLYAIECNPRATSGVHLFKHENQIDKAFFNIGTVVLSLPKPDTKSKLRSACFFMVGGRKKRVYRFPRFSKNYSKLKM